MAKVWINPAFKDKIPETLKKKEEKPETKQGETKDKKKSAQRSRKDLKKKQSSPINRNPDPVLELKYLHYLYENQIPIEAKLLEGITFTGKIKWFSDWMISLEVEGRNSDVIFNRLMMIYYAQLKDKGLSEKEVIARPEPDIKTVEVTQMQRLKDNKIPILFHLKNNINLTGTIEWCEKLIYHVKSLDETKEHNLYRASILYFEEVPSQ